MKHSAPSPWDFSCPPYDQRSSIFMNAGTHHGVGKRQPVGTEKHSDKGPIDKHSHCKNPGQP